MPYGTPKHEVPRVELTTIIRHSDDPIVRALAATWLSAANDPSDIPVLRSLTDSSPSFLWFRGYGGTTECPGLEWDDAASLQRVGLDAIGHIAGRTFLSTRSCDEWLDIHPDPRTTDTYWQAHFDQRDELWQWDRFRYLRLILQGWLGTENVVRELAPRSKVFADLDHSDWTERERGKALSFAVKHDEQLGLSAFKDAWIRQWQAENDPALVVPLAILASRSSVRSDVLVDTVKRLHHDNTDSLEERHAIMAELLKAWPNAIPAWFHMATLEEKDTILTDLSGVLWRTNVMAPRSSVQQWRTNTQQAFKPLVTAMSDRELFDVLPRMMLVMGQAESYLPPVPFNRVVELWKAQKRPGRVAPEVVLTMDDIRSHVSKW